MKKTLGSALYKEVKGWRQVGEHPRARVSKVDMCAADLIDEETEMKIKKPSGIWHSNEHFTKSLEDLKCSKDHDHAILEGTYKGKNKTLQAQTWTWKFAARVAAGVSAIIRDFHRNNSVQAYADRS